MSLKYEELKMEIKKKLLDIVQKGEVMLMLLLQKSTIKLIPPCIQPAKVIGFSHIVKSRGVVVDL